LDLLNKIHKQTGKKNLVMSGGVCLNSVTNGMIKEKTPFENFFIQPAAHDAGLSLGCAYLMLHKDRSEKVSPEMKTSSLGPSYTDGEIENILSKNTSVTYRKVDGIEKEVAQFIGEGKKVAWFQGGMEYGPRALGNRSILADARRVETVTELNNIKSREAFRPFAISLLEEKSHEWLVRGTKSPFMLLVDFVKDELKSRVPSAQHYDGSVRVQTVNREDNNIYYNLIKEFYTLTGVPMIINTSFNIKGKPIVRTPQDAVDAFLEVDLDILAIGTFLVTKNI
jgi:carbamoyltransferase